MWEKIRRGSEREDGASMRGWREFGLDSAARESSKHCYDVSFCFCLFIEILIIQRDMINLFNASISQLIIPPGEPPHSL